MARPKTRSSSTPSTADHPRKRTLRPPNPAGASINRKAAPKGQPFCFQGITFWRGERVAAESGKSKGQFYTPSEVSRIIAKVIGIAPANAKASTMPVETPVKTPVKTRVKTPEKILEALGARSDLTLAELAIPIGKSVSAVERATAKLVKEGRLKYVGPQKSGHWEVLT